MSDENCCGACGYPIHATKDKACDWCRQTANRIEALTAKLAKAVEAASPLLNMDVWTESAEDAEMVIVSVGTVRRIRAMLAEIEGKEP